MSEIVKTVNKLKRGLSFLLVTLSVAIFTLLSWVLESGQLSLSALEPSLQPLAFYKIERLPTGFIFLSPKIRN